MERVILHSDLNNFFASVECCLNPKLNGHPVAVAGDPEKRHGIVLAKNYEAKKCGVTTGEPLWQAKQKCPDIIFVSPHYDKYEEFSKAVKEIYYDFTDLIEPFGIDECWLDVTGSGRIGDGETIANMIRERVKKELGVTVSVGVSFNKIFAKLGSDIKKPDAVTVIPQNNFLEIIGELPAADLLFVGHKTAERLSCFGINTIEELAKAPLDFMRLILGKNGETLWSFANGYDTSPVACIDDVVPLKSVSCGNTAPRDICTDEEAKAALYPLAETVSTRLRRYGYLCNTVAISVRDNSLISYERQRKMPYPGRTAAEIFRIAYELYKSNHTSRKPVRSFSIRASNLIYNSEIQLSMDPALCKLQHREFLEKAIDRLDDKYGDRTVFRAVYLKYPDLVNLHIHSGVERAVSGIANMVR